MPHNFPAVVFMLLAVVATGGCASVTTAEGESLEASTAEFRAYVERVFREQNRVATELAFVLFEGDDLEPAGLERLEAADARLLEACAELNELAVRQRDGQRLGPVRGTRAARRAPQCEAATLEARAALDAVSSPL